jgi:hypothetical protein
MNKLYRYWWVPFILFLLLLAYATKADAGEVRLTWGQSEGANGYKVYHGTSSGGYGEPIDVGGVPCPSGGCAFQLPPETLLDGCVVQYLAVTAYNGAGESDFSNEVSGLPRPIVVDVEWFPSAAEATHLHIVGGNFGPAVEVFVGGALVDSAIRQDCGLVRIPVSVLPPEPGPGSIVIRLCNTGVCVDRVVHSPAAPTGLALE